MRTTLEFDDRLKNALLAKHPGRTALTRSFLWRSSHTPGFP